jgi:hypothetical protein
MLTCPMPNGICEWAMECIQGYLRVATGTEPFQTAVQRTKELAWIDV